MCYLKRPKGLGRGDDVKDLETGRLFWIAWVGPITQPSGPPGRGSREGQGDVMMETEVGMI